MFIEPLDLIRAMKSRPSHRATQRRRAALLLALGAAAFILIAMIFTTFD